MPPQVRVLPRKICCELSRTIGEPSAKILGRATGCGGVQWPAAEVLAKYLTWLSSIDTLSAQQWQDKQIVELGAGTGVLSLALASLLPKGACCRKPLL